MSRRRAAALAQRCGAAHAAGTLRWGGDDARWHSATGIGGAPANEPQAVGAPPTGSGREARDAAALVPPRIDAGPVALPTVTASRASTLRWTAPDLTRREAGPKNPAIIR